jgi:outer membrane lipoprotein SlyB
MQYPNRDRDLLGSIAAAAVGAGIVTTFAIGQGQHPLVALAVTAIAVAFAVACRRIGAA